MTEGSDFRVYDGQGNAKTLSDILIAMDSADVVLVGEEHNDGTGHGVEAQLLYGAAERYGAVRDDPTRPVVLSLEMFERDVQYVLDEYLQGLITEDQFRKSARPWDNYQTDYRPLVEFARAHHIPVVAANAPRRYVNRVTRLGPDSLMALSERAKESLPPLPYPPASAAYTRQWNDLMRAMAMEMRPEADSTSVDSAAAADSTRADSTKVRRAETDSAKVDSAGVAGARPEPVMPEEEGPPQHSMMHALDAQALWDASMGYWVSNALEDRPGALVLHMVGSFHVERGTGIPEKILAYRPGTHIVTVVLHPASDIASFDSNEDGGLGDFVVLTHEPGS